MIQKRVGKQITTYLIFAWLLTFAYYQVWMTNPIIGLTFQLFIVLLNVNHLE